MQDINWRMTPEQKFKIKQINLYKNVNFECRKGWYELLYDLGCKITSYCKHNNISLPKILQIKEKFGTLSFYVDMNNPTITDEHNGVIRKWITNAEENSSTICEKCGREGKLINTNGILSISCNEHMNEHSKIIGSKNGNV